MSSFISRTAEKIRSKDGIAVMLLILLFLAAEIIINPIGEFPLNDDWSYTRSLKFLYTEHHLHLAGFTSMPLIGQLAWGLLFCKIFGFSFTILRLSTLVLGLAGVLTSYLLIRELSGSRELSFIGALIVLFNPVYLNLSNTFMTDVPFFSMLLLSMYCFVKVLRGHSRVWWLIGGICFVSAATMIRQLGLLAAFSFAFCILIREWRGWTVQRVMTAVIICAVPLGIYLLYNAWLKAHAGIPVMYYEGTRQIFFNLLYSDYPKSIFLARQLLNIFIYCGLFIFPLVFLCVPGMLGRGGRRLSWYYGAFLLAGICYFLVFRRLMPFTGNILNTYGLGIASLRDIMILKTDHLGSLSAAFWLAVTLAGCIGGGWILFLLVRYFPSFRRERFLQTSAAPEAVFLYYFMVMYMLVMEVGANFDRYFIPLVPVICALTGDVLKEKAGVSALPGAGRRLALGVIFLYGLFSVTQTSNYFSWNRARWEALNYLMRDGHVSPARIDGGFEFNGYYLYDDTMMRLEEDKTKKSWWWVKDDEYLISFGPVDGYTVEREYPYRRLLSAKAGKIFILRRQHL
ncbi:MAG: glycosyltransferase family 39 protein [Chitinophagaceae bacterium]|nr:glycosyltransferase family 39 protein [Chitinophagaceae bacterium]